MSERTGGSEALRQRIGDVDRAMHALGMLSLRDCECSDDEPLMCASCVAGQALVGIAPGIVADLLAALDTPDSEPSADVPAWQPIATAPKDGTRVLLAWPYWRDVPIVGWWQHNGGWQAWEALEGEQEAPTHWMPLPAAPVPATELETSDEQ